MLVILIAAGSFAAVSRVAEYIVVSEQMYTIAEFFQSTGVLTPLDGNLTADIADAAELVEISPIVMFGDRRRGFEGLLRGIQNPAHPSEAHWLQYAYFTSAIGPRLSEDPEMFNRDRAYAGLLHAYIFTDYPGFARYRSGDAFFSGTLVDVYYTTALDPDYHDPMLIWMGESWFAPNVNLVVRVDNTYAGYYDHLSAGAYVILRYHLIEGIHPFEDIEIGGRYFFKGTRYNILGEGGHLPFSREAGLDNPRRRNIFFSKPLNADGLFYVPLSPNETLDFDSLGLSHLVEEIIFTNHVQSNVYIRTTRDMASIGQDAISVHSGRLPNEEDYLNARNVVAIHEHFANYTGIAIGDTITVTLNREQHLVEPNFYWERFDGSYLGTYRDLMILSSPLAEPVYELELEIIGIYEMYNRQWPAVRYSSVPRTIYIPDSILPSDLYVRSAPWGELAQGYTPAIWYSFVLQDSRYREDFISNYGNILEEMGFRVDFLGYDSANFWISANMTLQSMVINLVLFTIVLMLVLALAAFFALNQRRRDFAVLQALGLPPKTIKVQFMASTMLLWISAVIAGSWLGWNYSLEMAMDTLQPFAEMLVDSLNVRPWLREEMTESFLVAALPDVSLLALMCVVIILAVFVLLFGWLHILLRHPVLEQLQGRQAQRTKNVYSTRDKPRKEHTGFDNFALAVSGKSTELTHILLHILRMPMRTVLLFASALFFVLSLGLLSETIYQATGEIDRLYDTTVVGAEVFWDPADPNRDNPRSMRDMIPRHNFLNISNLGFVGEHFVEANNGAISVILPRDEYGGFPHDLLHEAQLTLDDELRVGGGLVAQVLETFDMLFATNELRFFTEAPSGFVGRFANTPQTMSNMEIIWIDGFDEYQFEYLEDQPIPVVASQRIVNDRLIGLGDDVYIAITNSLDHMRYLDEASQVQRGFLDEIMLEMSEWNYVQGKVVGIHNSSALLDLYMDSAIIPLAALESLYGSDLGYVTLRFGIDVAFNRDLQDVERALSQAVRFLPTQWWNQLAVAVNDRELMFVIVPMEENLSLLQLLYPIAVVMSILLGAGLHILLMFQNVKNAAIMTVLGTPKSKTRFMLWLQFMLVSSCGTVIALILLLAITLAFRVDLLASVLPFLIGAMVGTAVGATLVTNKSPLELLQVKE